MVISLRKRVFVSPIGQYNSNYEWYVSWGFYFGVDSYCHLTDIEKRIDEVIARGFKTDYVRPVETEVLIENIKKEIEETRKLSMAEDWARLAVSSATEVISFRTMVSLSATFQRVQSSILPIVMADGN